ncbi:hypothetical protein ES708_29661 [subsurface metagenome]
MPTVEEAIKRLKWNGKQHVAVAIWSEDDVLGRAKERGIKCSRAWAREIIDKIDNKQDCSLGITWDTIDCYLLGV